MSYPTNPQNPQYPGGPAHAGGGRAPGGAGPGYGYPQHQGRAAGHPRAARADDGFDVIPMKKSSPLVIVAIAVAILAVGGVLAWNVFGGKKTSPQEVEDLKAKVADSAAGEQLSTKEQLEHIRRTRAAMEKYEAEEKQRQAAEAAKQQAEEEEAKRKEAAKAGGGGPAPVSGAAAKKAGSDLDSIGADYASQLGGN